MHIIQQAFGEDCDLYKDVLNCPRTADKAALRKAYYRTALVHHPDKNPNDPKASALFQAVTAAYQILQDPDLRAEYDETGVIPDADPDEEATTGVDQWKSYFDQIFGKVTAGDIEAFSAKYKCSDEERRDVLKEYKACKGNLVKMLEFVMLSSPRDAARWVEDYIRPAIASRQADGSYTETMEKTLKKLQKKVEQEDAAEGEEEEEMGDDEETESEDDDEKVLKARRKRRVEASAKRKTSSPPKKAKSTAAKSKQKKKGAGGDMTDLIAQIQSKRGGGNGLAALGARYGVAMDDDPLDDKEFERTQAKMMGKKKT